MLFRCYGTKCGAKEKKNNHQTNVYVYSIMTAIKKIDTRAAHHLTLS